MIVAALSVLRDPIFRQPPESEYINAWVGDQRAVAIHPGYLLWPGGRWIKDLPLDQFPKIHQDEEGAWHELSTFKPRDRVNARSERLTAPCPRCTMALPASGVCDCL